MMTEGSTDEVDNSSTASASEPSPRGFGCPGNEYECNRHCRSNGFRGGYCNALTAYLRCDCY